jgi:2-methylisocitrate lyase-like PEP mutase family enzyme
MHDRKAILQLPNAWDAGSARLFAQRDFVAISTTSGGVAWSRGYADGEQAPLDEVLAAITRTTRVVELPATVDRGTGYGDTPDAVTTAVQAAIAAGAVGINSEDGLPGHGPLRPIDEASARLRDAREAAVASGVPVVINARVDSWMHAGDIDPAVRLSAATERAKAYLIAGADCIYPIGASDPVVLVELAAARSLSGFGGRGETSAERGQIFADLRVHSGAMDQESAEIWPAQTDSQAGQPKSHSRTSDAPVNVAAGSGMPGLIEVARLGAARVSSATRFATLALGAVDHAVRGMLETGRFGGLAADFNDADAQRLFVSM